MAHSTRAAAVALLGAALLATPATGQEGRGFTAPRWRAELGAAFGSPYATDDAGVRVTPGIGGMLGIAAAWDVGARDVLTVFLRGSTNAVRIDADGAEQDAGSARQLDLGGALERTLRERIAMRAGVSATWLSGPTDVVPFRFGDDPRLVPAGEAGAAVRLTSERPLWLSLDLQAFRLGGATIDDPVETAGWVQRALVGLRYGR
jgi:hypothetical protein